MKKKILASIAASCMLVAATAATSFAAIAPSSGVVATNDTTLVLEKTLNAKNPSLSTVAGPGLAYTFTIAPATVAEGTVVDDGTATVVVKPGPAEGLKITKTPEFAKNSDLDANTVGDENIDNLELEVDITKFARPGVYRYKLTDTTTNAAFQAADVTKGSSDDVRYIDVYIVYDDTAGVKVSAYVVGTDKNEDGTLEKKTLDPDLYETYNIILEKEVSGTMGDRNHQFPFAGTINNDGKYFYAKKGKAPTAEDTSQTTTEVSTTLSHLQKYYVSGLSKSATYQFIETNDTEDIYKVKINGENETNVAAGSTKDSGSTSAETVSVMKFTNTLNSISPTGIVMRYGPYVGMVLLAGLFIFMRRRASASDEA